ncbi:MAG: hypothetical protein Q8P41_31560 [Pseudomonadota bacterium]|nr:hypothetical protein [Pseudomonadota bacterium]
MKRLLAALLLATCPALGQTVETRRVDAETRRVDGSSWAYSALPAPTGCLSTNVPFFGSDLKLGCATGLTYTSETGTLAATRVTEPANGSTRQSALGTSAHPGNSLSRADAWAVYDAGATSGLTAKRFWGAIFDGRYVYYVPGGVSGLASASGVVLRYDTTAGFTDPTAWVAYNAAATGGLNTTGYRGGTYDGRYLYLSPDKDTTDAAHGRVLRYDTRAPFTTVASWSVYDASGTGSLDCRGYSGALYDGTRYVYFAPFRTSTDLADYHGRVLRYDTTGSFTASGSWSVYDAAAEHGSGARGYKGIVSDGRFLYFAPNNNNGAGQYTIVLRYDMTASFSATGSWDAIDAQSVDGLDTEGYSGAVFDGRYVTFVPIGNSSTMHGRVLRYDTRMPFLSLTSWSAYDAGGAGSRGFVGAVFDGRYINFSPYFQGVEGGGGTYSGLMGRYDTERPFKQAASWESYDGSAIGGLTTVGYAGGAFDGRYWYLAPYYDGTAVSGKALRFDTGAPSPARTAQGSRGIGYRQEIPFDKILTDNVATTVFEVALAAGDMIGSGGLYSGTIIVTATEGTNVQAGIDAIRWTAVSTAAAAQTCAVANVTTAGGALSAPSNSTGTLGSYGWSCDIGTAGKVILSYRVDSSLTAPVVRIRGVITVESLNVVTLL